MSGTDAIEKLLDPTLENSIGMDYDTKLALVASSEQRMNELSEMLEKMESLRSVLESAHIKGL